MNPSALTLKDFCDAYRLCREKAYQEIRAGRSPARGRPTARREGRPLEFIGIDTTSRALAGGDENSPKDLGQFVRCCDIIRAETRAHLCTVHHLGKDESRGARGHSLLKAALDTEITAVKSGATGAIEVTKQRDHPDGQRFGFAIELVDLGDSKSSYVVIPSDAPPTLKACRWSRGLTVFRGAVDRPCLHMAKSIIPLATARWSRRWPWKTPEPHIVASMRTAAKATDPRPSARLGSVPCRLRAGLVSSAASQATAVT